jgi:MYXO-CTERM domain-containing protein
VTKIAAFDEGSLELAGIPNICLFDSGGPTLLRRDGVDVVVGIHAVVESAACDGKGYDMRVDHYTDFVDRYIAAADPPLDAGAPSGDASVVEDAAPPAADSSSTSASSSSCAVGGSRARSPFAALFVLLFAAALARRQLER